jgi:hypothetical protein
MWIKNCSEKQETALKIFKIMKKTCSILLIAFSFLLLVSKIKPEDVSKLMAIGKKSCI